MNMVLAPSAATLLFLTGCDSDTDFVTRSDGTSPSEPAVPFVPPPLGPAGVPCDPWCPGADIPGWPVLPEPELPELEGKPIVDVVLPPWKADVQGRGGCGAPGYPDCEESAHPGTLILFFGDDEVHWYVGLGAASEPLTSPPVLGLGWYESTSVAPDGANMCTFFRDRDLFSFPPENCSPKAGHAEPFSHWHPARAYLSEVRPDRIRGIVYFDTTDSVQTPGEGYVYLMHFEMTFPPHGGYGMDFKYPEEMGKGLLPRAYWYSLPEYLSDYDTIWPWDSITDPAIRETIYRTYRPYLDPFYP